MREEAVLPWELPGKGVFETMRAYDGKIFALDAHLKRMQRGLKALKIKHSFSSGELRKRLRENLKPNSFPNARIRLTVWQDKGPAHISIVVRKYHPYAAKVYLRGFRVRIAPGSFPSGKKFCDVKPIRYERYLRAYQQILKKGGEEAVLLNKRKEIVEASRSNIFIVKDGILYTPVLACGCLNGVTRTIVIKLARKSGIPVKEARLSLQDLQLADEAFLTNSLMEVMPLTFCQGKAVGSGKPGVITKRLAVRYKRETLE